MGSLCCGFFLRLLADEGSAASPDPKTLRHTHCRESDAMTAAAYDIIGPCEESNHFRIDDEKLLSPSCLGSP
jgi:hypothetical protein